MKKMQNLAMKNQKKIGKSYKKSLKKNFICCEIVHKCLFSNQQLNFNFDTVASLLSILYADLKSHRSALLSYKVNLLNSIPTLLRKRLSLVPKSLLIGMLNSVYDSQKDGTERVTLAIPMQDLFTLLRCRVIK